MKSKNKNDQQLMKDINRVFPSLYVGIYFLWVRPLWLSALPIIIMMYKYYTAGYIAIIIICITSII